VAAAAAACEPRRTASRWSDSARVGVAVAHCAMRQQQQRGTMGVRIGLRSVVCGDGALIARPGITFAKSGFE
jgi:hypothetical protein